MTLSPAVGRAQASFGSRARPLPPSRRAEALTAEHGRSVRDRTSSNRGHSESRRSQNAPAMAVLTCIDLRFTPARWTSGRESPVKACSCELTASTFQDRRNGVAP
ncbi:MAG: hypothetical protein BGO98_07300 [Myxococcales bacterium 68-20]|nr:MAG: hypothetical protein BGO98_07300 [Myxococcales bacterium 68-20]